MIFKVKLQNNQVEMYNVIVMKDEDILEEYSSSNSDVIYRVFEDRLEKYFPTIFHQLNKCKMLLRLAGGVNSDFCNQLELLFMAGKYAERGDTKSYFTCHKGFARVYETEEYEDRIQILLTGLRKDDYLNKMYLIWKNGKIQ